MAHWVAIVATFLKCGWVCGIEPVGTVCIGTIRVALLVRIQTFPFHAMAINARDMVITPLEVERSPETEFPFTLFFPQAPRYAGQNVLQHVPRARLIFLRSKGAETLQSIDPNGGKNVPRGTSCSVGAARSAH